MLAREHWVRVPELTAGERSGLFAMEDALYGCYLRVGDPGPWAGPWAGIARLEMPSGIGRAAAVEAADRPRAGWPGFASALHPDARAPLKPDADRESRTPPASPPERRAPRDARGFARRCSNPTASDGRHDLDDDGTDRFLTACDATVPKCLPDRPLRRADDGGDGYGGPDAVWK